MKRSLWLVLLLGVVGLNRVVAQIASFSFSGTPSTVSGWTNLPGDPHSGAQTATMNGITVSSISPSNWVPNTVPSNVYNFGGAASATYFPTAVMANTWLQWNGNSNNLALYNASVPQLLLSGLNADSTYILRMSGSDIYYTGSTQFTVAGASVSGSQNLNTYNNTTQGVTFQHVQPDASGTIRVYVNATSTAAFAFISGLQVFSGTATNVGTPVIALTAPTNGTIQSEGGNFILTATASETGGSIAKVEFYADTTKIGEADAAPYAMTWIDPDPGSYQLTAKATDAIGTIATASVNVGVQSLNYFWSTTGNIATNGDTNFIGTVDTNRLSFRTNNLERMSISPSGTVMVGTESREDSVVLQGTLNIEDTSSSEPVNIEANNVFSPWVNLRNPNSGIGASMGMRNYNDSGLVAQFFSGSYHDVFVPNGYAFHLLTKGGFEFVAQLPGAYMSWGNNFKVAGGSEMIFYPSTGHLIIGSTTDNGNNKLQVNGNTWTSGLTIPTGAAAGYVLTSDASGNASWQQGGGSGGRWLSLTGAVYDSLDNIGIGTSNTQGYRLAVNGSAIVTRIVVKPQSAWPDYVFKKGYRLPRLDSLERYILDHHHLPGVASAEEVGRNGLDVGGQETLLLQKLEEHSLYLIDENKQLAGQNEELSRQNARLEAQQEALMRLASQVSDLDKEMSRLKKENVQLKKKLKNLGH